MYISNPIQLRIVTTIAIPVLKIHEHSFKTMKNDLDQIGYNTISTLLISAKKLCNEYDAEFIWKWPQITHQHQINNYYKILESQLEIGLKDFMVDGLGAATSVQQVTPQYKIIWFCWTQYLEQ